MQVLDQDGSATLSKAFEPATEPLLSLLMWLHEWFALEPAPSKAVIVAPSLASTALPAIPTMITIVLFHLLFTMKVGFSFLDAFFEEMLISSHLFLVCYHII